MSEIKSSATHREMAAEDVEAVAIGLVTVSDSRTPETDTNAIFLRGELEQEGHTITSYQIVPDEPEQIEIVLEEMIESLTLQAQEDELSRLN